jgi:hypothetical protein
MSNAAADRTKCLGVAKRVIPTGHSRDHVPAGRST